MVLQIKTDKQRPSFMGSMLALAPNKHSTVTRKLLEDRGTSRQAKVAEAGDTSIDPVHLERIQTIAKSVGKQAEM